MVSLLREAKRVLAREGIRLRKGWGQNFLIDKKILEEIVSTASLKGNDIVLEIGPGGGALTKELAKKAKQIVAIEIDPLLVNLLKEELEEYPNVTIIQGDILKFDLSSLLTDYQPLTTKIKVVANLPYYITSPLFSHLLKEKEKIGFMVIMVQKEVGERILAQPGSKAYGLLTIFLNYHTEAEFIAHVPRRSFLPPPKVEGMVLKLKVLERPRIEVESEDLFFKITRIAFTKRRKMLVNALSMGLGLEKKKAESLLLMAEIDPKRRPETLSLQEFGRLSDVFEDHYSMTGN